MNRIYILGFILLIISSCTVYKEYPIEIYQPGEIAVPPGTESAAIVYRNFKYPGDTLQHYYQDDFRLKKARKDPKELDSIIVSKCLNQLAKNLKAQNLVDDIYIFPKLFKPHHAKKLPPLNFDLVNTVTTKSHTDLLISLETFSYFYSEYSTTADMPTNSNEVITAAVWAIYNPYSQALIERKTMIDTIFWNGYNERGDYQRKTKLPPRITALKIAAQMAGENYAKRFSASWQTVKRNYSVPPLPDFSAADEYVQKAEWDNAILLWKRYAADKNGKMAINARYNLAFAYEMKDDINAAQKWLTAALQIANDYKSKDDIQMILRYQKILSKRQKDIERLNQM